MKNQKLVLIYVVLALSHVLSITSLVMQRNEIIMTLSLILKLFVTVKLLIPSRSKLLLASLIAQIASFGVSFISGTFLLAQSGEIARTVGNQSFALQISYILMGIADALVILYVSKLSRNPFLTRIYQVLSFVMVMFVSVGTLGFAFPIPTILDVMVSVFEVTGYAGFVATLLTELYLNTKSLKTEEI
ncbi:hypothetical protein G7061_03195 [Erysipelothrix sp. HDW6B]|uniref:hypothetical protein n=1 Tax=Erysipelothrix sp. HDW6B TaxID=2714929 RepID=UPI00140E0093|nr:hypothetical protein [Erysipelothrix sp. HDW6B]QIK85675.1 hypothetical protein G7061_03195 [Erysipelothrix sp. HDW6B]